MKNCLPNWGPIFFWQNETHSADYYGLQYDTPIDHGTTHLSAVDKWGGAASVTSTVSRIHYLAQRTREKNLIIKRRSILFGGAMLWTPRRVSSLTTSRVSLKLSMECGAWSGKNREPQTSVDVWMLIESFD